MKYLGVLLFSFNLWAQSSNQPSQFQDPLFKEYSPVGGISSVAVVVHGLNTRPSRMLPIVNFLNANGVYVLNVSLSGHRFGTKMKYVTASLWQREMKEAFEVGKLRSLHYGVPLNFVGYSLGALVGITTLQKMPQDFISQAVLLAPALSLTKKTQFMKLLSPFSSFGVPSMSPMFYRANWATSVACYNAVFALKSEVTTTSLEKLSFPTYIIVDPKDELVSWNGLQKIVPPSWGLLPIDNSQGEAQTFHHLILDAYVLGVAEWTRMTNAILGNLRFSLNQKVVGEK